MDAFIVNCKPGNWEICNKFTIFGLKDTNSLPPPLRKGDLILFRISGPNYGLKALWYFEYAKKVVNQKNIKLTDDNYTWILNCKKILTLTKRFSEEFQTSSKKSSKITDLYAGGIQKAVVAIKAPQLRDYIFHILKEHGNELTDNINYLGEEVNVNELLKKMLAEIIAIEPFTDRQENEIAESIIKNKEKPDKPASYFNGKADKPSVEKKDKPEKQIPKGKEKDAKTNTELEEIVNEPVSKNEEKSGETVSEVKEISDEPSKEKEEKLNIQIPDKKENPDKTEKESEVIITEPVINHDEKLANPVSDMNEKSDESSTENIEKSDKEIAELKEKQDNTTKELEEIINEPVLKHEEKSDEIISDTHKKSDEAIKEKEENSNIQNSEQKENLDNIEVKQEGNNNESELEQKSDLDEPVLESVGSFNKSEKNAAVKISEQQSYEQVGERINLPILNYAPLNEKGILLLFGHYMKKLGISHVEEIRTDFPDAIAIRSAGNGRYQRVRIGFEFNSSSFLGKGHNTNECDLIVCWNHDWNDCPIEVIELSKVLFDK